MPFTDENLELVKQMGSKKGYDPIPPDQYLYFLNSADEVQRVVAWVRSKTIRLGHRSPWAVTPNATRPLTKADLARDCFSGNRGNAVTAWTRAEQVGLVFVNEKGFLCLNGAVPMPPKRRTKGEPEVSAQTPLPRYLIEKIRSLPEASRNSAEAHFKAIIAYRAKLEHEAVAMARIAVDRIEDSISRHYFGSDGKKRMDKKHRPDLHEEGGSKVVQLELLLVPESLQEFAESAQIAPQVRANSKNGSAQIAPSIYTKDLSENPSLSVVPSDSLSKGDPHPQFSEEQKADEEESYRILKAQYPEAHYDEPKAKPLFLSKTPAQQKRTLERLQVYLDSDRWQKSPEYIPFASSWLKSDIECDPPPFRKPVSRKSKSQQALDEAFGD